MKSIFNQIIMKLRFVSYLIPVLLLLCMPVVLSGQQSDYGIIPKKKYVWFGKSDQSILSEDAKPIVQIPPMCGKKRRGLGHDLAMPFGLTAGFSYTKQYYYAGDLRLSNDSTGIYAEGEASVQNSTSSEMRMTFKPDIWLLPILNVYGIIGYSQTNTRPDFEVPQVTIKNLPIIGEITLDTTIHINDEIVLYSPTYGGGATVSAGYKWFFFFLDYHYTVNKPGDMPDKIESHNFSGKLGVLLGKNEKAVKGSFWAGVNYINDNHKFTGEIDVKDILPELVLLFGEKATYSGTVTAKQYWNIVMGGSVIINKHHLIVAEIGYFKREQLSLSYGFRF